MLKLKKRGCLKVLLSVSVIYLCAPNLLFFYNWFKSPLNLTFTFVTFALAILYFINLRKEFPKYDFDISLGTFLKIYALSLTWVLFSGIGNYFPQPEDFFGHHSKLINLVDNPWPLIYEYNKKEVIYYFSYYLVPASLMKLFNSYNFGFLIGWSHIGYLLVTMWAYVILSERFWKVILLLLVGGSGIVLNNYLLIYIIGPAKNIWPTFYISLLEQSFWVPNQFIPALITTFLLIALVKFKVSLKFIFFPLFLSITWGIFPALTLSLIVLFYTIKKHSLSEFLQLIKNSWFYGLILIPILIYFQSSNGNSIVEFVFLKSLTSGYFQEWLRQILPEVIIFVILTEIFVTDSHKKTSSYQMILLIMLFSLVRVGEFNDFVSRSAIVLYAIELYFIVSSINKEKIIRFKWAGIIFILSFLLSFKIVYQKVAHNHWVSVDKKWRNFDDALKIYPFEKDMTIYKYFKASGRTQNELIQYSSKEKSVYQEYFAPDKDYVD